jgi:DNA-binding MarR family transcriptional regulator
MSKHAKGANPEALESLRQHHIGRLLLNAQRNYSVRALAKLRERGHDGLTLAHTNLLAHLDVGGTRITTLAERVGVTKQAIGTLVGELEARSYVRREPDPADRRAWVIAYTEAGRDFLQDAHEVKQEIEGEYAKVLGAAGLRELRVLLGKLVGRSPAD